MPSGTYSLRNSLSNSLRLKPTTFHIDFRPQSYKIYAMYETARHGQSGNTIANQEIFCNCCGETIILKFKDYEENYVGHNASLHAGGDAGRDELHDERC